MSTLRSETYDLTAIRREMGVGETQVSPPSPLSREHAMPDAKTRTHTARPSRALLQLEVPDVR